MTTQGAIRVEAHPQLRLFPYEGLSSLKNAWTQGVLVCLPTDMAVLDNRAGLFEIGEDPVSLFDPSSDSVLFDLGLNVPHLNACIRTRDKTLIDLLRSHEGANVFDPVLNIYKAIASASPTRVFISKTARIEVFQNIPDTQGATPSGPHTHLSEKLLSRRQTQAATIPVPDGWVPVYAFYPPNPIRNSTGDVRPFDTQAHQQFQALFKAHGAAELVRIKNNFLHAMTKQTKPAEFELPRNKAERTSLRIAIRQYAHQFGPSLLLSEWYDYYEPTGRQ